MKTAILITLLLIVGEMKAGPIKALAEEHPEQISQIIRKGTYAEVLSLVKSAYNESTSENDDPETMDIYSKALAFASLDRQIPLALDFSLTQPDPEINHLGAEAISNALLRGVSISSTQRSQAIKQLKDALVRLSSDNNRATQFAIEIIDALILLRDDAGLDALLTSNSIVRSYDVTDNWDSSSVPAVFADLVTKYQEKVRTSDKGNSDREMIRAATYELCRLRRIQGMEIKPIHPLINLDQLVPR